jgi:iron complex transport system substrate-binding protein
MLPVLLFAAPVQAAGFPVTLTDALGHRVTVRQSPRRIVALAPAATEALFALGLEARIVGDTTYCDYPARARSKTKVGGIDNFSVEKVLALRPDLVVAMPINPKASLAALRRAGAPVFAISPTDIPGVMTCIETLGQLTGRPQTARGLVARMRQRLDAVRRKVAGAPRSGRPTALLIYQVDPIRVAGGDTFPADVLEIAGGVNLARDVHGYSVYSVEAVVAKNPQFILAPSMVGDRLGLVRAILARRSLQGVGAVRHKRVYALNADTIDRPGPRIVEGVEEMARVLHPGLFGKGER